MEKVQKTTQSVKPFGSPDEHGNQGYWVNFTDGSKGIFNTPRQDLFIEGQPAEFSIKEMRHSEKAGDYAILQRYKEPYELGKKSEKSSVFSKNSEKFMCLSYAKDIFISFNGKMPAPNEVTAYAEALYSETINGTDIEKTLTDAVKDGHQKAIDNDVLPF